MFENILSPIEIGKVTLKNRIIFAPTTLGLPTAEYESKIKEIAQGGCAMIIIGDVPVAKHGARSLHSKKGFAYYQHLCEIVHEENCLICAQLHQSDSNFKGMIKYIPGIITKKISHDDLRSLMNQEVSSLINEMPESNVHEITTSFGPAALLAQQAGFDMIQVHGDRMCGSFSSSLFNKRDDTYGGSVRKRAQFAIESISAIRKALPTIPIDYKLAIRQVNPHYGNAGILVEELATFVPLLEEFGVNSFHVTLANHGQLSDPIPAINHPEFSEEGCFLKYCDEVRKYTNLPICGVGALNHPKFIEEQLAKGRIQCAAMSRQLIADPQWVNKVKQEEIESIHYCIRCNKRCLGGMQQHQGVHCIFDKEIE